MPTRRSRLTPAVAISAVLVLALAMLVSRGLTEALVMIAVVAVLTGMYVLRRYARAELLYRRDRPGPGDDGSPTPSPAPTDERRRERTP